MSAKITILIIPIIPAEAKAKHTELKDQDIADKAAKETNKTSGKAKLKTGEALTDAEVEALFG